MSTIWAEMLTGVYASPMAVDATLQPGAGGDPISLRAMDKTSGVVFGGDNDPDIQTIYPVATVLMSALDEAGVSHEDLDGGTITLDGKLWNVKAHRLKPSPDGELKGEAVLILSDEAV